MNLLAFVSGSLCIFLLLVVYVVYNFFPKKYTSDTKVTVIIFNNKTSKKLGFILKTLVEYPNIDQIVVIHFSKNLSTEYNHPKIDCIEDFSEKEKFFKYIKHIDVVRNEALLFLDNETLFTNHYLKKILERYDSDIEALYGTTYRLCNNGGYYKKSLSKNIIHDDILLTSKKVCKNLIREIKAEKSSVQFCQKEHGDFDDILFDYLFKKNYNKQPCFVNGKYVHYRKKQESSSFKRKRNDFCKQLHS